MVFGVFGCLFLAGWMPFFFGRRSVFSLKKTSINSETLVLPNKQLVSYRRDDSIFCLVKEAWD